MWSETGTHVVFRIVAEKRTGVVFRQPKLTATKCGEHREYK
jgi:hypothetical protein